MKRIAVLCMFLQFCFQCFLSVQNTLPNISICLHRLQDHTTFHVFQVHKTTTLSPNFVLLCKLILYTFQFGATNKVFFYQKVRLLPPLLIPLPSIHYLFHCLVLPVPALTRSYLFHCLVLPVPALTRSYLFHCLVL